MQNLLPFEQSRNWERLPSPKIRRGDHVGVYSWDRFYSAFSERFALAALNLLQPKPESVLIDPFVGGGTTAQAAAKLGLAMIGVDLDPFSVLLSRARLATRASIQNLRTFLEPEHRRQEDRSFHSSDAEHLFSPSDLQYASVVFAQIEASVGAEGRALCDILLQDVEGKYDTEVIALTAVLLAANDAAALVRGSNPVWFRKALPGEELRSSRLPDLANQMTADLLSASDSLRRRALLLNTDFLRLEAVPQLPPPDLFLTSPPYLNRLDYVIKHLAPLTLLSGLLPVDTSGLRKQMMGTTKIGEKHDPSPGWGSTCLATLDAIRSHPSKASSTYYLWIYSSYFNALFKTLRRIKQICQAGARGATVVQNSYYKELPVPLPEILLEMAAHLEINSFVARREKVRAHLGTLSPTQRAYLPTKVLEESVVYLELPK